MSHSKLFPPSGAWPMCAGWEHTPGGSKAASEGTLRHMLAESWMLHRISPEYDPELPLICPTALKVDGKMMAVPPEAVDDVKVLAEVLDQHPAVMNHGKFGYHVWVEQKVNFGTIINTPGVTDEMRDDMTGTVDLILATPNGMEIWDHKFGRQPQYPTKAQLKLYALGAGAVIYGPEYADQAQQIRELKLTIGQPHHPDGPVVTHSTSIDRMVEWAKVANEWVAARIAPKPELQPSDDACFFCNKKGTCPARNEKATAMVVDAFAKPEPSTEGAAPAPINPVEMIPDLAESQMAESTDSLSDADLSRLLDYADPIIAYLKGVKEEAIKRMAAGQEVPGWKRVHGRRSKVWTMPVEDIEHTLVKKWRLAQSEAYETKFKTIPNLMKAVHAKLGPRKQKEFDELWTWKEGAETLAPADDPRPAVVDVKEAFEAQEETTKEDMPDWY